ncbi:uncharacterized protein ZBIST_2553 [Zygosaccharomyces bailii]|nr:uncharacterized protein ZBIST_2553 [Zygosaccharomyces bailii]
MVPSFFIALALGPHMVSSTDYKSQLNEALDELKPSTNRTAILEAVAELHHASVNVDECQGCLNRLTVGKKWAREQPGVVPEAYTTWCLEYKAGSNKSCNTNYARTTVERDVEGSNFVDLLQMIDPEGYDAALYCHYLENGSCDKPKTPDASLSYLWPPKQKKHYVAPEPGNETFNVLHISDFHIELDYTVGAEANCSAVMCCTPHSLGRGGGGALYKGHWDSFYKDAHYEDEFTYVKGAYYDVFKNKSISAPAPTFGHYRCDAPEILINSSINSVTDYAKKNNLNFEFALFTGDLIDHDEQQWMDFERTLTSEEVGFRDLKNRLGDLPVYSTLGNHDSYPYGEIAQEGYGFTNKYTWNNELMAHMWKDYGWLNASTAQYARTHYTGFAVDTKIGLRIISLNSNCYYRKNHYAFWNATNPDGFGIWSFLIEELVDAESKDQRVWIMAHIPPIVDGLPLPSKIFYEIIERFSPYTIAGIFFGHTHLDQFNILYAANDTKSAKDVINHAWISQAVTPWFNNNPSWRYYEVDKDTFSVMNAFNYYVKLNETFNNGGDEPEWLFEYSCRDGYNVTWPESSPLNASYWHKVAQEVKHSVYHRQMYENYATRFSPYVPDCSKKGECLHDYCTLTSFQVDDFDDCVSLVKK